MRSEKGKKRGEERELNIWSESGFDVRLVG